MAILSEKMTRKKVVSLTWQICALCVLGYNFFMLVMKYSPLVFSCSASRAGGAQRERTSISHSFPEHICMKLEGFVVWFGFFFLEELFLGVFWGVLVLVFVWVIFLYFCM